MDVVGRTSAVKKNQILSAPTMAAIQSLGAPQQYSICYNAAKAPSERKPWKQFPDVIGTNFGTSRLIRKLIIRGESYDFNN